MQRRADSVERRQRAEAHRGPSIEILNIERECSKISAMKPLPLFQLMKLFHCTVYLVTFDGRFLKDNAF
jgi:hypothetical protein